jgi:LysR family glycine cleavage system transcriptional activator
MSALHNDQGLRIVECAVRHRSFARAADELGMTRAAVSAQVRGLEDRLGLQLFERNGPGIKPTPPALALASQLAGAYLRVDEAVRAARGGGDRKRITVSAVPNLASAWLMPRLAAWFHDHPDVDLHVDSSTTLSALALDGVDLALRDGYGDWSGLKAWRLMDMRLAPLAAPAMLKGQSTAAARWMPRLPLLGLQRREWLMWMRAEGVDDSLLDHCRLHVWDCWRLVADATLQGAGVGLLPVALYDLSLERGHLRRLGQAVLSLPRAHWVVTRPERLRRPEVRAFLDWLREEAASTHRRTGPVLEA